MSARGIPTDAPRDSSQEGLLAAGLLGLGIRASHRATKEEGMHYSRCALAAPVPFLRHNKWKSIAAHGRVRRKRETPDLQVGISGVGNVRWQWT